MNFGKNGFEESDDFPRCSFVLLCGALLLAALPLLGKLPVWTGIIFLTCLGVMGFLAAKRRRVRSPWPKMAVFASGVGGIMLSYGTLFGVEAGTAVTLILVSLKLLETKRRRDLQVLTLLGYFLCLSALFFSQDLILCVYVGFAVALITAALVHSHLAGSARLMLPAIRTGFVLLIQALPLLVLLFFLFPRIYGGFRFQLTKSMLGVSGMSDRMSPGSMSSLALSDEVAFRVEFPDGIVPRLDNLYWRGAVMWQGDGLTWDRGSNLHTGRGRVPVKGPVTRQRIVLEPHGGRWLFAMDRPASEVPNAHYEPGGYLQSIRPIFKRYQYEVLSRPDSAEPDLPAEIAEQASRKPNNISPAVQDLVDSWLSNGGDNLRVVEKALRHFRTGSFVYTLDPGAYVGDGLDEFLFQRRKGFCEHYAAAFASLMRIAGIPSRVVAGYQGGQYNEFGNYVIVRQADAHAWCEVWLEGRGWIRVDPTTVVAPARLYSGLQSFLESHSQLGDATTGAGGNSSRMLGFQQLVREARLAWDMLDYQWNLRVLNYDGDTQRGFFALLGVHTLSRLSLLIWVGLMLSIMVVAIGLAMRQGAPPAADAVQAIYRRFCRQLRKQGLEREEWEGPLSFSRRAANTFPEAAAHIKEVTALYVRLRYRGDPFSRDDLRNFARRVAAGSSYRKGQPVDPHRSG